MHIIYINIGRQRVKVAIVCTISVRTHLVMIPVLIASPLLSDRALIEGILKDVPLVVSGDSRHRIGCIGWSDLWH